MVRLILFLLIVVAAATGLAWLADRPGNLVINWEGYEIETSVFRAVVLLAAIVGAALFVWSLLRQVWTSPAAVGQFMARRRQQRGLEALSSGMIAIGAGDRGSATRYAIQARKALPNEPLTHLLRAQAAQLSGDGATSRRIFEAMLASPDTEQLGLRGLFLEAQREGETEAARQFAERAIRLNPKLEWAVEQLFELQCREKDWAGALETAAIARRQGHFDKSVADRRRAVILTAQAIEKEDSEPERALSLAIEAHGLAPDLVPAAALAGRMLASRGNTPRATKIIQKSWSRSPHPDLATVYAYARLGDSPRDRYDRVRQLALLNPMSVESAVAASSAAIEAKAFDEARSALEPFLEGRLTQRICLLMARIEGEQHGNRGRVREWLARAVNAPRDPAWTADGVVSDQWAPISPVTGALDAFQWRVPVESAETSDSELLQRKLEELVPLGAGQDPALAAMPIDARADAHAAPAAAGEPTRTASVDVDVDSDVAIAVPTERPARGPAAVPPARPAEIADAVVVEPQPAAPEPQRRARADEVEPLEAQAAPEPVVETSQPQSASSPQRSAVSTLPAAPATAPPAQPAPAAAPAPPRTSQRPRDVPTAAESNARASAAYARLSEKVRDAPAPSETAARARNETRTEALAEPNGATAGRPVAAATGSARPGRDGRTAQTQIFVPPRAPDDPGPDAADVEELRPPVRSYRASS